jgi:arylsulfatase A-like enzyme
VLFITIDTLRADHLGCYGYFRETSPRIDALAEESLVFERCAVPMATTLPSHVSMLTGAWPLEHGVLANVAHGGRSFRPSPGLVSAAEVLEGCGYRTAAFTSAKPLRLDSGVDSGFQLFDESEERERRGDVTVDLALAWLERAVQEGEAQPFFLWVHLFDPHDPFQAPPAYDEKFRADARLEGFLSERQIQIDSESHGRQLIDTRRAHDGYDGEVLFTDAQVGRLLDALERYAIDQDTIVILLGDHGEGLGQHGMPGHGFVWNEQLQSPLMMRVPGVPPRRIELGVSSIDVFPTLLGQVHLPCAEDFLLQSSGVDVLSPEFAGRPVFSQSTDRLAHFGQAPAYALSREEWKYVLTGAGPGMLFDLDEDPHELRDVAAQHPEVAERLEHELLALLASQARRARTLGQGEEVQLDPATLKALEDLGYLGGSREE